MTGASRPAPPDPQAEALATIQGWCPECNGSGMVMDIGGPTDCPNLNLHRTLAELEVGATLLSRQDTAAILGVDFRAVLRLMDAELLPFTVVGKTYVFRYRDVQAVKAMVKAVL